MKLTKKEFKDLLKECILELAQEGKIFQGTMQGQNPIAEEKSTNGVLTEAIDITTRMVTKGDPSKAALFKSIIEDTARTTLQKQLQHDLKGGDGLMSEVATPEDKEFDQAQIGMFAASNRWAQVAFGKIKNE